MDDVSLMAVTYSRQNLLNYFSCIIFVEILLFCNFVKQFTAWTQSIEKMKLQNNFDVGTYSVTRKNLFESWKNSYNFKMLGWSRFRRILISPRSLSFSSFARLFLLMILTALNAFDSLWRHFLTSPNAPINE